MHIPERMCIACRSMKPKSELIRIVKNGGEVALDMSQKSSGRGAYICKSAECLKAAKKRNVLSRHFKMAVSDEIYDDIKAVTADE